MNLDKIVKMNNPQLSIVIATYNSFQTIARALDSVRYQSFQDWECIVVDGASTDDTIKIVAEYAQEDSRFRYVSEKDNGIYDAFNKGWKMAKGEWIHYLGSDDWVTENGFHEIMCENYENIGVITGDVWYVKPNGQKQIVKSMGWLGSHQGKLVRRFLLHDMDGFNENYRIKADWDLLLRMQKKNITIKNIPVVIAYFSGEGISQSSIWQSSKETYYILRSNGASVFYSTYKFLYDLTYKTTRFLYHKILLCFEKCK